MSHTEQTRTMWVLICPLNTDHFSALTISTENEVAELHERIRTCQLCGAPLQLLDVALAFRDAFLRANLIAALSQRPS